LPMGRVQFLNLLGPFFPTNTAIEEAGIDRSLGDVQWPAVTGLFRYKLHALERPISDGLVDRAVAQLDEVAVLDTLLPGLRVHRFECQLQQGKITLEIAFLPQFGELPRLAQHVFDNRVSLGLALVAGEFLIEVIAAFLYGRPQLCDQLGTAG